MSNLTALKKEEEDEPRIQLLRKLPHWLISFFIVQSVVTLLIVGLGFLLVGFTTKSITSDLHSLNGKVDSLLHVVGTKTAEEVIFLKIKILNRQIKPKLAREIATSVHHYGQVFKRDPNLILAIMRIESNFDPKASSEGIGAEGLMQVLPQWKEQLGIECNLKEVDCSIMSGLRIYGFYDKMYKDIAISLTAYNRGPGMVDYDLLKGVDPTRNLYAKKVLDIYEELRSMSVSNN